MNPFHQWISFNLVKMNSSLPPLTPFRAGSNPSDSCRFWHQDFRDFTEACMKYGEEPEMTKTAL